MCFAGTKERCDGAFGLWVALGLGFWVQGLGFRV